MNQVHKESQETYDFIADWIDPNFFFSKKDVWHRFGMLGVFGDFVLSCTPGNIAEIGVGESSIYLSHLARKYFRMFFSCDISPSKIVNPLTVDGYLVTTGVNRDLSHNNPSYAQGMTRLFVGPSDAMWDHFPIERNSLALTFIDGDHLYDQVAEDFRVAVSRTVDNGYILLHDTHPPSEEYLGESRCGTVYQLRQEIERMRDLFDCITLPKGCAIDVGLTIVRKKPSSAPHYQQSLGEEPVGRLIDG